MKHFVAASTILGGASALVARSAPCCFQLTANGGPGGPVGQLDDGQNRIGQDGLPRGTYCLDSNGGLTDGNGKGCILTPPTTQWQCDAGANPDGGFAVNGDGTLTHSGSTKFISCPTGDRGAWNIYSDWLEGEPRCVEITLQADNCASGKQPAPSQSEQPVPSQSEQPVPSQSEQPVPSQSEQPVPSQSEQPAPSESEQPAPSQSEQPAPSESEQPAPSESQPAPSQPTGGNSCPAELTGNWEFPHLIIPVDSSKPDEAPGTSLFGKVSPTLTSIFNFDIPQDYSGKKCSIVFLFPKKDQLETSDFSISGSGDVKFNLLDSAATQQTIHSNAPNVKSDLGTHNLAAGNSYVIDTEECPAGQVLTVSMESTGDTDFSWFEDYNPSPIGLYVTTC